MLAVKTIRAKAVKPPQNGFILQGGTVFPSVFLAPGSKNCSESCAWSILALLVMSSAYTNQRKLIEGGTQNGRHRDVPVWRQADLQYCFNKRQRKMYYESRDETGCWSRQEGLRDNYRTFSLSFRFSLQLRYEMNGPLTDRRR